MPSEMEDGQVKSEISDCEVSIASSDEKDSQLVERREIGSDQMHAYYTTPPARRLPPELVAEILYESQPPYIEMHSNSTLCSICSVWRAVAVSTPRLWTTIRMTLLDQNFSEQMALLRLWCERAGSLPLKIFLSSGQFQFLSENPILALTSYLPNVQTMELHLPSHCVASLQSLPKVTFRSLESLSIDIIRDVDEAESDIDIDVFESAQRLTSVYISIWRDTLSCRLQLPPRISHIEDHTIRSANEYFHVLQHCPNVEHLMLRLRFSDDEVMHHRPFQLPHLHTLDFEIYGFSIRFALDSLVAPAVQSITIRAGYMPYSSFLSLILRSSCTPVRLRIGQAFLDVRLLDCLRGLPSIVELEVGMYSLVSDALVYNAGDTDPLVPRLEVLKIHVYDRLPILAESLVRMVESRWWPDAQLSDPHQDARLKMVRSDIFYDPVVLQRLRRCQDEGLDIGCL